MGDAAKLAGVETSAKSFLKRAVELDSSRRFDEAVTCYQEGLQLLLEVLKGTQDDAKKKKYREKISEYMARAEELKQHVKEEKRRYNPGKYHEQIRIEANSTGHTYEKLFSRFIDKSVSEIEVEDPYIRPSPQVYNFLRFCELVVKRGPNVKKMKLITGADNEGQGQQQRLHQVGQSLHQHGIHLEVDFSSTLHDREIRFNNGWVIKIGRGLDMYKATENKFSIGFCDFELRHCHETTVDIFHRKNVKSEPVES
ncbi:LOW QUALITY PROTEIN: MIT domain-containing protein 1-like [Haliotis rubra]|uniref:LOW QUALITY PROTEIN: MIT domain-containing protein 1-like n=1 Tax=Haliotis rubra TaxID=36100 RepID=UPI001EE5A7E2|nr:LOW QUALITY PROTEIN: MIT domain-containing protein 1-like [Haliotis rubra]